MLSPSKQIYGPVFDIFAFQGRINLLSERGTFYRQVSGIVIAETGHLAASCRLWNCHADDGWLISLTEQHS